MRACRVVLAALIAASADAFAAPAPPSQSKISVHLLSSYSPGAAQIIQARPRVIKILGTDSGMLSAARDFRASTPDGKVVCRIYTAQRWTLANDPAGAGTNFWQTVLAPALLNLSTADKALIDYVEGPNEGDSTPTWGSAADTDWYNTFWIHLARQIAAAGFRPLAYSISVGNPPGTISEIHATLDRIAPSLRVCQSLGGGWSYHSYSLPYGTNLSEEIWYSVRYRQYYSYFASVHPDLVNLPLILTEGGIDGAGPWSTRGDTNKFQNWLMWFDQQIRQDNYCLGVTLFQIGETGGWNGFNVEPIAGWLANYLNANAGPIAPVLALGDAQSNTITLTLSAAVHPMTATNRGSYRIHLNGTNVLTILSAVLSNETTVLIRTSPQTSDADYLVTVSNLVHALQSPGARLRNGELPVRLVLPLIRLDGAAYWKYDQRGVNLGTTWRQTNYNDGTWSSGAPLFAYETASLPEPIRTPLTTNNGKFTFYFRKPFFLPAAATNALLRLRTVVDDGVVFYLNGGELFRLGVTENPVIYTSPASRTVSDATNEGPFLVTATNLLAGTNLLAAEVHQVNATSSDVVFGTAVDALVQPSRFLACRPILNVARGTNAVVLNWLDSDAMLEAVDAMNSSWVPMPGRPSPQSLPATNAIKFYRLRR